MFERMVGPRPSSIVAVSMLVGVAVLADVAGVVGQTSSLGQWSAVFDMPLVAVHAALMQTGQVLMFDAWEIPGTPSARLWDPSTNTYISVPNGFAELFCSGHVLATDGRLLTSGGHNGGGVGTTDATSFDPVTRQWTQLPFLNYARWYPAVAQLADGRVLTMGGSISRPDIAEIPETYVVGGSSWVTLPAAQKNVGEYPLVLPFSGSRVFVSDTSSAYQSWVLNVDSKLWTGIGQSPAGDGSAVMYRQGKVMMSGGGANGSDPVNPATGVIDLNASSPTWRTTAPMAYGRTLHNFVILPDGKVLAVGGSTVVSLISTTGVLPAEIWDPSTETWTTVASMATPRMYHSTALLLPDGRVLAAGGGRLPPAIDHLNGEIYSPPYLFRGTRPQITGAPASITYGSSFVIDTPDSGTVARVTLVRSSSVTHARNYDQRFVELAFVPGANQLTVEAPTGADLAPAGYYMLFVLDANGVPSVGRLVRIDAAPTGPTLSIDDVNIVEGTGGSRAAVFAVTLTGSTSQTVSVDFTTLDGSATAGNDYIATSGRLTFTTGTSTATITVPIVSDSLVEANETFNVALSNATNAALVDGIGTGTIIDDDAPAVPTLFINAVSVTEGTGSGTPVASFTVTLAPAAPQDVLVSFRTVPGTAVSPFDYASTSGTLTFAGGTTVQTIQVPIVPDDVGEPDETFTVELSNPANAVIGQGTGVGTIVNDDTVTATFTIAAGADDVIEDGATFDVSASSIWLGNGASAASSFTGLRFTSVSIPRNATIVSAHLDVESVSTQWISVDFEYSAHAASDSPPFSTTSKPSQRTALSPRVTHSSNVQWLAGTRYSLDEIAPVIQPVVSQAGWNSGNALSLILHGTGSAWSRKFITSIETAASRAPRLVVTYNLPGTNSPPVISSASANPLTGPAPLAVSFSGVASDPDGDPLTFTWAFGDETTATGATASHTYTRGGQYTATLTVADGHSQTVSSPLTIQVGSAPLPTLSINDVTVSEGNTGTTDATFTVTLSAAPGTATATVVYATVDGTAVAPGDYTATAGTLTFSSTTVTQAIVVKTAGDTIVEPNEAFTVTLSNPSGATVADGSGTGTITNDDVAPLPTVAINDVTVTEGDAGTVAAVFTLTLSNPSTQAVTVSYATANGTATAGSDYTATSGTASFAIGTTTQTVTVAVRGDLRDESDEFFYMNLSNPVNATIADGQGIALIVDNDPAPALSIADVTVTESNNGTKNATSTVTLSIASGKTVTVNWATADGTATSANDYTARTGTLTFDAGITSRTLTVPVRGDRVAEPTETFFVDLTGPDNASITRARGTATIVDND
jgi:hypothetical protein